jgi:hypothetical protein
VAAASRQDKTKSEYLQADNVEFESFPATSTLLGNKVKHSMPLWLLLVVVVTTMCLAMHVPDSPPPPALRLKSQSPSLAPLPPTLRPLTDS